MGFSSRIKCGMTIRVVGSIKIYLWLFVLSVSSVCHSTTEDTEFHGEEIHPHSNGMGWSSRIKCGMTV